MKLTLPSTSLNLTAWTLMSKFVILKHKNNLLQQECLQEEGRGKQLVENFSSGSKKCVINPNL
jgi:hypothetical protein